MLCGIGIQTAKGYHHYEIGLVRQVAVRPRARRLLARLRAGAHRALARQPEVPRPFRDDRVLHRDLVRRLAGLRAQPLQVRRQRRIHVLGHERLRPLPAARADLPGVLDGGGGAARRRRRTSSGCAARRPTGKAGFASRACVSPGRSRRWPPSARSLRGARRLHLLQHQRAESLRHDLRPRVAAGGLREEVQAARVVTAAEDHRGQGRRRSLSARAARPGEGDATRSRTARACRSTPFTSLFSPASAEVVHALDFATPAELVTDDLRVGLRSYKLASPLAARRDDGARASISRFPRRASRIRGSNTDVVYNGSFVNGRTVLPIIGYQERGELATDQDRKKFGLAPKERMRDRDDPAGLAENGLATDADFIAFEATVGTDADQSAIAPGYLQREWTRGRSPLLRLPDGQPDPQLLRVPVGALRGEEGPLERRRDRDLLPARPRVQPRPDDRRHQGRARLFRRRRSVRTSTSSSGSSSSRATRRSRNPSRTPSRTRRGSASSPACATTIPRTSTTRTT